MQRVKKEHIQVLKTLYNDGRLTRQAMKSIRGQILNKGSDKEREEYLRKIIRRSKKNERMDSVGNMPVRKSV